MAEIDLIVARIDEQFKSLKVDTVEIKEHLRRLNDTVASTKERLTVVEELRKQRGTELERLAASIEKSRDDFRAMTPATADAKYGYEFSERTRSFYFKIMLLIAVAAGGGVAVDRFFGG